MMAVILYFTWAYPIGYYKNAIPTNEVHLRGAELFLFVLGFLLFASTFAHFIIAAMDTAETAGNIANLLFSLCLIFCGGELQSCQVQDNFSDSTSVLVEKCLV